jgi:hypothetical protein
MAPEQPGPEQEDCSKQHGKTFDGNVSHVLN